MRDIKVRALGKQVTIYDNEGNIIEEIPPPPEVPPTVRYVNIVEIEDRIMGIDSSAKPDFFIDFENDYRFRDLSKEPELCEPPKFLTRETIKAMACFMLIEISSLIFGYTII